MEGDNYYQPPIFVPKKVQKLENFRVLGKRKGAVQGRSNRYLDRYFADFVISHGYNVERIYLEESLVDATDGEVEDAYLPTRMSNHLVYDRLAKYNNVGCEPNWEAYEWAKTTMMEELRFTMSPQLCTISVVLDYIDKKKSPGILWKVFGKTKEDVLKAAPVELINYVIDMMELRHPLVFWSAKLKDELRQKAKVVAGKTRLFTGSDFGFLVFCCILCLDFNMQFYDRCCKDDHVVGTGKYYGLFDFIARKLTFENKFECDWDDFDGTVRDFELLSVAEMRSQFFPDFFMQFQYLYEVILTHPFVLPDGLIIARNEHNSQTSGNANTIVDNTLVHDLRLRACWYELVPMDLRVPEAYKAYLQKMLIGDDNIGAISNDVIAFFNPGTIKAWAIKNKLSCQFKESTKIDGMTFIGHKFLSLGGVYVPVLSFERLFCGMLRSSPAPIDALYSYNRACAYRVEGYYNEDFRILIDNFLLWMNKIYGVESPMLVSSLFIEDLYGVDIVKRIRCEESYDN